MSIALKNTIYFDSENTDLSFFKNYKVKNFDRSIYKRFIVRCRGVDFNNLVIDNPNFIKGEKFELCPPRTNNDITQLEHYKFSQMNYLDELCKDNVYYSFCLMCSTCEIDLVIDIFNNKFEKLEMLIKKSTDVGSITIKDTYEIPTYPLKHKWIDNTTQTRFPINIQSLGRFKNNTGTTHKLLCKMKIFHHLWVEPQEFEDYANWFNPTYCSLHNTKINYSTEYNCGSTPVRNHILNYWENEVDVTPKKIWMLDDNIICWKRMNNGRKITYEGAKIFTSIEDYTQPLENVKLCSHNFNPFIVGTGSRRIIVENEKHYSSLLISLGTGLRFKTKYNEDIVFSLENIMSGYNTLCFNHILYDKKPSGLMGGGNSQIYDNHRDEGYIKKWTHTYCFLKIWEIEDKIKFRDDFNIDTFWEKKWLLSIEPIKRKGGVKSKLTHNIDYSKLIIDIPSLDIDSVIIEEFGENNIQLVPL